MSIETNQQLFKKSAEFKLGNNIPDAGSEKRYATAEASEEYWNSPDGRIAETRTELGASPHIIIVIEKPHLS